MAWIGQSFMFGGSRPARAALRPQTAQGSLLEELLTSNIHDVEREEALDPVRCNGVLANRLGVGPNSRKGPARVRREADTRPRLRQSSAC